MGLAEPEAKTSGKLLSRKDLARFGGANKRRKKLSLAWSAASAFGIQCSVGLVAVKSLGQLSCIADAADGNTSHRLESATLLVPRPNAATLQSRCKRNTMSDEVKDEVQQQHNGFELVTKDEAIELEQDDRTKFLTDELALEIANKSGIMSLPTRPTKNGNPMRSTGMNQHTLRVKGGRIVISANVNWFADKKGQTNLMTRREREALESAKTAQLAVKTRAQAVIASQDASADERAEAEALLAELG